MKKLLLFLVLFGLFVFVGKAEAGWYCSGIGNRGDVNCPNCPNYPALPCSKSGWFCVNVYNEGCAGKNQSQCSSASTAITASINCGSTNIWCAGCYWVCANDATTCGACSVSCGGGTRTCTNTCSSWSVACNTQSCCTISPWVNQACGTVANGCGYETMRQTRTQACGGATSQCVANLACAWPGTIQNTKVINVSTPANALVGSQTVNLNNPLTSLSTNPANFSITTVAGATRTVSVLPLGGYEIGYSLCYNSSCSAGSITPGNSAEIIDANIRALGPNSANPYASVYWHYCPTLGSVTILTPGGTACVATPPTSSTTMSWGALTGATNYHVVVRENGVIISNTNIATTSQVVPVTVGNTYTLEVTARNACGGSSATSSLNFSTVVPPSGPGTLTGTDIGGGMQLNWTVATDGQRFLVSRTPPGGTLATVSPTTLSYLDSLCATYSYRITAEDLTKPAGCQTSLSNTILPTCDTNNSSWFAASGGGNLVAATGLMRSKVPTTVYNPYLLSNAEGVFPGFAIGDSLHADLTGKFNTTNWYFDIATNWNSSNILVDRENTYDGMKERIWSRVTPTNIDSYSTISDLPNYPTVSTTMGTTGVYVAHHTGSVNIGSLDMTGKKLLLFVEGNVNITGNITGGFLAVIAKGNINVDPSVGTTGLTMDVDVRPWNVASNISGIFYAGGVFSTGTFGGATRDNILKIDGTVIGMSGVNLQRNNVGKYPVEFFNFQPGLITQLSEVGLRRKIVRELLNP